MFLPPPSPRPAPPPPTGRLAALSGGLGLLSTALLAAGGRLPAPPGSLHGRDWSAWLDRLGAPGAAMALLRLAALGATGYLLLVVALELVGRATEVPGLALLAHVVDTPWAARIVQGLAGVAVATTLTGPTALGAPAGATPAPPSVSVTAPPITRPVPTMHQLGGAPPGRVDAATRARVADPPEADLRPSMRRLDAGSPLPTAPAAAPDGTGTWTIGPGDHLWGVAARTLAATWDRAPSDAAIAAYVAAMVEVNREVLVVPGDADLVLPGQVFTLPPAPTR